MSAADPCSVNVGIAKGHTKMEFADLNYAQDLGKRRSTADRSPSTNHCAEKLTSFLENFSSDQLPFKYNEFIVRPSSNVSYDQRRLTFL
jgi:hypothetical protein